MAEPLRWTTALLATVASLCLVGHWSHPVAEPGDQRLPVVVEDRLEPTDFSPEELKLLQRRFGVHGPQTQLAQLFTSGVDQLKPLRASTLDRLRELKPVILRQAAAHQVNPMLITAVLFDEIQHSKPGESLPFIAHSGLVKTHGPAQISISELIHQNRLPANPTQEEITWARNQLLDPEIEHHPAGGKIPEAEVGTWLARELDVAGEPLLPGCQGHRHPHLSPQWEIGLPSARVGLHAGP